MLSDCGMQVVGRGSKPRECIDAALACRPDVVVLDVQLDGGTGLQVLHGVRAANSQVAFVVFSIHASDGHRKLYLADGAYAFLDKATDYELLVSAIRAAAQHGR